MNSLYFPLLCQLKEPENKNPKSNETTQCPILISKTNTHEKNSIFLEK